MMVPVTAPGDARMARVVDAGSAWNGESQVPTRRRIAGASSSLVRSAASTPSHAARPGRKITNSSRSDRMVRLGRRAGGCDLDIVQVLVMIEPVPNPVRVPDEEGHRSDDDVGLEQESGAD